MQLIKTLLLSTLLSITLHASYKNYCNARFGFCVEYFSTLGMHPAPTNNDGRSFFDNEGFSMSVYGSYNALHQSLQAHRDNFKSEFDTITYTPIKKNWYILSGYKGDDILYIKVIAKNDTFYTLYIKYPKRLKTQYNDMVTQTSQSFKVVE